MPFLFFSNANIKFVELEKFTWISYIVVKVLSTISQVDLIDKKKFVKAVLDENSKTLVVYILTIKATKDIYLF